MHGDIIIKDNRPTTCTNRHKLYTVDKISPHKHSLVPSPTIKAKDRLQYKSRVARLSTGKLESGTDAAVEPSIWNADVAT